MRAGPEGAAGVDDDVKGPLARLLPGRAQPDTVAGEDRAVVLAPAVGPVVCHFAR